MCYVWSLSRIIRNRLAHCYEGNTSSPSDVESRLYDDADDFVEEEKDPKRACLADISMTAATNSEAVPFVYQSCSPLSTG